MRRSRHSRARLNVVLCLVTLLGAGSGCAGAEFEAAGDASDGGTDSLDASVRPEAGRSADSAAADSATLVDATAPDSASGLDDAESDAGATADAAPDATRRDDASVDAEPPEDASPMDAATDDAREREEDASSTTDAAAADAEACISTLGGPCGGDGANACTCGPGLRCIKILGLAVTGDVRGVCEQGPVCPLPGICPQTN